MIPETDTASDESIQVKALRELRIAERAYLLAFGWTVHPQGEGRWLAPSYMKWANPWYEHNHAVNLQKAQSVTGLRKRDLWPEGKPLL